jgi:HTH-type transcriptional regulator/antitoxin HigA
MTSNYQPDFMVHPGEHLEELLETSGMTQAELADRLGVHKKTVNEIVKGKASVSSDVALRLSKVFHYPAHLWNNMQRNFDETAARLAEEERLKDHLDWLKQVPVKKMIERGWLPAHKAPIEQLDEVLRFFGIASPDQWQTVWQTHQVAYRQSQRFEPCALALSAWLRQGELQAQAMACAPFDRKGFQQVLDIARGLTREGPHNFEPQLIDHCARVGVALVFVPELPKTGVSGCTRWLGGKAVIQLSLRYKSNDQLWFTFFHEAGHIMKHGKKEVFLEGKGLDGEKEEEANNFARDRLIPPADYRRFLEQWDGRSLEPIVRFADEIGIAPGIVVGRLQFDKRLKNSHGNGLKVFYEWQEGKE